MVVNIKETFCVNPLDEKYDGIDSGNIKKTSKDELNANGFHRSSHHSLQGILFMQENN